MYVLSMLVHTSDQLIPRFRRYSYSYLLMSKRSRDAADLDGHANAAGEGHEPPNGLNGNHEGHNVGAVVDAANTMNEGAGGPQNGEANGEKADEGDVGMAEAAEADGADGVRSRVVVSGGDRVLKISAILGLFPGHSCPQKHRGT